MLKTYFNYVQNVLGAKSYLLPHRQPEVKAQTIYNFAVQRMSPEDREILLNIIKALKAEKSSIVELKLSAVQSPSEAVDESSEPDPSPESFAVGRENGKSVLIIFGENAARFLIPQTPIQIGEVLNISGSDTLLTHSIKEMRVRPELKREAWQHLKAFINN
jgi:hypothetical protein